MPCALAPSNSRGPSATDTWQNCQVAPPETFSAAARVLVRMRAAGDARRSRSCASPSTFAPTVIARRCAMVNVRETSVRALRSAAQGPEIGQRPVRRSEGEDRGRWQLATLPTPLPRGLPVQTVADAGRRTRVATARDGAPCSQFARCGLWRRTSPPPEPRQADSGRRRDADADDQERDFAPRVRPICAADAGDDRDRTDPRSPTFFARRSVECRKVESDPTLRRRPAR